MKMKRSKFDIINATVDSYLKRRRYQDVDMHKSDRNKEIMSDEIVLNEIAETGTSRHNSIVFSTITHDVATAHQAYNKIKCWINSVKNDEIKIELKNLLFPIFCHLYLEMLHAGNPQAALHFLKTYQSDFNNDAEKDFLEELSSVFSIQDIELRPLVNKFRTRKYKVNMSDDGHIALQKYLAKNGNIIIMQIINIYISIIKKLDDPIEENDDEKVVKQEIGINGHVEQAFGIGIDREMRELQEAIRLLRNNPLKPLRIFKVSNSKENSSCASMPMKKDKVAVGFSTNEIRLWAIGDSVLMKPNIRTTPITLACDTPSTSNYVVLEDNDNEIEECGAIILRGHTDVIHSLKFIGDLDILLSVSSDNDMRAWRLSDYTCAAIYSGHNYPIWCMDTCLFGLHIATGSHDRTAKLWSLDRRFPLRIFAGHFMDINAIKFHPGSRYLATGSTDKSVRLWNRDDGKIVRSYVGSQSTIYSLAFSPDGRYLAAAGEDKSIMIWDMKSDSLLTEIKGHESTIMDLDWSPDGQYIVSGSMDGIVKLWSSNVYINNSSSSSSSGSNNQIDADTPVVQEYSTNSSTILSLEFDRQNNSPMCIVST